MDAAPPGGQTSLFVITAAGTTVRADPQTGRGAGSFTVSNATDRQLRGRARVVALDGAPEGWATVEAPERDFLPRETQQFALSVAVPPGTAGSFRYQPHVAWVESTDDHSYAGPVYTVEAALAPPPRKRFPYWLLLIPVLLLVVLGVVGGLWWQGEQTAAAERAAATATAAAMDAAASATATAQAGTQARIARYRGNWSQSEAGKPSLTTLVIGSEATTLTVTAKGKVRDVVLAPGGSLAQMACPGNGECAEATRSLPYAGDPLSLSLEFTPQVVHQLTITITPDGSVASAVDQVVYRGSSSGITTYTFRRLRRPWLDDIVAPIRSLRGERDGP